MLQNSKHNKIILDSTLHHTMKNKHRDSDARHLDSIINNTYKNNSANSVLLEINQGRNTFGIYS